MVEIPPKLRWACRRGMLELDVLLQNFLEEAFLTSSPEIQAQFIALLQSSDQDLFEWFMKKKTPENPETQSIITHLLEHARSRNNKNVT
jgi:antitoxin CptB